MTEIVCRPLLLVTGYEGFVRVLWVNLQPPPITWWPERENPEYPAEHDLPSAL